MKNSTAFVLLAGGKSERMGVAKGLLKYKQTFWILEQLNRISKTSITNVFIGLGYNYQYYFDAIPWFEDAVTNFVDFLGLHIKISINKHPQFGTFSTLQTVLKELDLNGSVLLNPIDNPILNPKELQEIINTDNTVVIPNFKGKNGHPIKMDFNFWQQLLTLDKTNATSRLDLQIKKINPTKISKVEVLDSTILRNLNSKKDWILFLNETN
ncbi:NTP transferase domain-containing protein [Lutibacter sp.]